MKSRGISSLIIENTSTPLLVLVVGYTLINFFALKDTISACQRGTVLFHVILPTVLSIVLLAYSLAKKNIYTLILAIIAVAPIIVKANTFQAYSLLLVLLITIILFNPFPYKIIAKKDRKTIMSKFFATIILPPLSITLIAFYLLSPSTYGHATYIGRVLAIAHHNTFFRTILVILLIPFILFFSNILSLSIIELQYKNNLIKTIIDFKSIIRFLIVFIFIDIYSFIFLSTTMSSLAPVLANPLYTLGASIVLSVPVLYYSFRLKKDGQWSLLLLLVLLPLLVYVGSQSGVDKILNALSAQPVYTPLDEKLRELMMLQADYYQVIVLALKYMGLLP